MRSLSIIIVVGLVLATALFCPKAQPPKSSAETPQALEPAEWSKAEKGVLAEQIQLTFSDKFVKAGESYFSPDDHRVIFQAVETPPAGEAADEFYAMYVADIQRDAASGNITGLANIKRVSPKGSANTCGWFHPTDPNVVIFASTLTKPTESTPPGFQRASGRYKWMFPPEMRIVRCELDKADGTAASLHVLAGDGKAYCAEGSLSKNGRHLLYCSLESNEGDLYVLDLKTQNKHRIVQAKGYDGGPFFSPDGKRICYRSDRRGDNLLQLMVADLTFNDKGEIIGIEREFQLTEDPNVNWCPFWTRDGRRLIYGTSALGHTNYEVFMCDADPGNLPGSNGTIRYGTAQRRITNASGADVLPALSNDGKWMIWTSQRHADRSSQLWAAKFVLDPDKPWKSSAEKADTTSTTTPAKTEKPAKAEKPVKPNKNDDGDRMTVTDPDTGRIFIYDMSTHKLSEYHMDSHTLTDVTDKALIEHIIDLFNEQGDSGQPQ